MEHTLRCNVLKCRKELNDRAVVTTCSHILCMDCANRLQPTHPSDGQHLICPACDTRLRANADDAVLTNLNPAEDYKTSVLSGLNPNVIMECAGRALSFWAYQMTQEVVYQEYLAKSLTDKYGAYNAQMDKVVHDANAEISDLRQQLANLSLENDNVKRKNEDLNQAVREKTRKYLQTQELYDKLKRRAMLGQVQNAASDAVEDTINASGMGGMGGGRFVDRLGDQDILQRGPLFQDLYASEEQHVPGFSRDPMGMAPPMGRVRAAGENLFSNQDSIRQQPVVQTPSSSHRQRVAGGLPPKAGHNNASFQNPGASILPRPQGRTPLAGMSSNKPAGSPSGFGGYGMSAGLKVGHAQRTASGGGIESRPIHRTRGLRPRRGMTPVMSNMAKKRAVAERAFSGPPGPNTSYSQHPGVNTRGGGGQSYY